MRYARYAIFILLSLPLFGSPVTLSAQVGGQVLSEEGAAVSDVRVDIYDANRSRIATRLTGLDGRFLFDSMPSRRGATILLRRVGFTPTTANIAAGDTALNFVMHPVAVSLAEVTTYGAQRRCPQKDDGEARALWAAVASRYYPMPLYVDLMATVRERTGD